MKKPLKTAGICGIVAIVLIPLLGILYLLLFVGGFNSALDTPGGVILLNIAAILTIAASIFLIFFSYGLVVIAKKFNNNLLKIMSWVKIILMILLIVWVLVFYIVWLSGNFDFLLYFPFFSLFEISSFFKSITWIIYPFIALAIYFILFGISLLKLKKIKLAKAAGILEIINGLFCFYGLPVLVVAMILETMILLRTSKRFENNPLAFTA